MKRIPDTNPGDEPILTAANLFQGSGKACGRNLRQGGAWTATAERPASRGIVRFARNVLGLALLLALPCYLVSQAPTHGRDPSNDSPSSDTVSSEARADPFGHLDPAEAARRQQALKAELRQSMVSDSDRLLKIARELDDEVSRTNPDSLTPAELRKVAQIEKLAKKVRTNMNDYVRATPANQPLSLPVPLQRP